MNTTPIRPLILNPAIYTRSTPTAPCDLNQAAALEFAKNHPSLIQPAQLSAEQFKAQARAVINDFENGSGRLLAIAEEFKRRWREFGPTRTLACDEVFGCSLSALGHKIIRWKERLESQTIVDLTTEEDKENTLTQIANLPNPEQPLENGETVADYQPKKLKPSAKQEPAEPKPRANTDNGKPKWSLAIWKEIEEHLGRSLNRTHDLHRLCPNQKLHDLLVEQEHACSDTLAQWKENVKHA